MTRLFLTRRATLDLIEIEDYSIETSGKQTAEAYIGKFQTAFGLLRESPDLLRRVPEFSPHLYFYRVGQHWIIACRTDDATFVLTICHGSMDLPSRVAELEPLLMQEVEILVSRLRKG
ncbi:MAG: type II toxin-antitoxin system RelE/ParE family toxin [Phycisphaerales bacterium JB052]